MKKLIALLAAAVLAGCASTPELESKAGVEDRTPTTAVPAQPGVTAVTPIAPKADQLPNALKDPKNILSKRSVFFDYDSDRIRDEFRPLLQAHGKYLGDHAGAKMLVQGNADERGSREYNLALGQRRAEAIKRMLALMGARDAQIDAVSLGEEKPRCTEQSEACWAENRRGDLLHSGEF